jgi:predicted nucleic acid-binding protein
MNAEVVDDIFLDTNILVYAYDISAGVKNSKAKALVEQCWTNSNGCLSIQVLQELYVTVTRKITPTLDYPTARQIIADLAHWRLHCPEANDLLLAMQVQQDYQLSFWDALVVQSARRLGCQRLYSEDLIHGKVYIGVQIINPFT